MGGRVQVGGYVGGEIGRRAGAEAGAEHGSVVAYNVGWERR